MISVAKLQDIYVYKYISKGRLENMTLRADKWGTSKKKRKEDAEKEGERPLLVMVAERVCAMLFFWLFSPLRSVYIYGCTCMQKRKD